MIPVPPALVHAAPALPRAFAQPGPALAAGLPRVRAELEARGLRLPSRDEALVGERVADDAVAAWPAAWKEAFAHPWLGWGLERDGRWTLLAVVRDLHAKGEEHRRLVVVEDVLGRCRITVGAEDWEGGLNFHERACEPGQAPGKLWTVWRTPLRRFEAGLRETCGITFLVWLPRWGLGTWVEELEGDGSDEMEDGISVLPQADLRQARLLGRAEGLVAFRAGGRLYCTDRAHAAAWHLDKSRGAAGPRMVTNR